MLASGHPTAMRFDHARDYLLSLSGSEEGFPFGPEVMVFKVGGKMFATLAYEEVPCRLLGNVSVSGYFEGLDFW